MGAAPVCGVRRGAGRARCAVLALLAAGLLTGPATAVPSSAVTAAGPLAVRVIGGSDVAPGALPFVVAVLLETGSGSYLCTGTVIAPDAVLTANHCAFDPATGRQLPASAFTVFTNTTNLVTPDPGAERKSVASVHAFTSLADSSARGDVAVLTLSTPTTAPAVRLATTADTSLYAEGAPVVVAGWGQTAPDGPPSTRLQQGTQALKANSDCTPLHHFDPALQLCAAAPNFRPSLCRGDSGGPLLASTPAGWVEIGVNSATLGELCGNDPDYYARVSTLAPWIGSVAAGTSAAPLASPPLDAPTSVALRPIRDGLAVSFPYVVPDPATLLESYSIALRNGSGRTVGTMQLQTTSHSWSFTDVPPGTYRAVVTADYSAGRSDETLSPPLRIAPPANRRPPVVRGHAAAGGSLRCTRGAWTWSGSYTLTLVWLRNGVPAGPAGPPSQRYVVGSADSGKRIACRVVLETGSGTKAAARSAPVEVR